MLYLTHATVQNLTSNLCIFIRLEGFFHSPWADLHILVLYSHIVFLITHATSTEELHTQHTAIYHLQIWEDRVGKSLLSFPLCWLYFILFMICRFSFFQKGSDTAKTWQLHQMQLSLSLQRNLLPHLQRLNKKLSKG